MTDAIFTAIFDDGFYYLNDKKFPAGSFAVAMLNDYEEKDYLGRAGQLFDELPVLHKQWNPNLISEDDLRSIGEQILKFLDLLSHVCPFSTINIPEEKARIQELFLLHLSASNDWHTDSTCEDTEEELDPKTLQKQMLIQAQDACRYIKAIWEERKRTINRYTHFRSDIRAFRSIYHNFSYAIRVVSEFHEPDPITIAGFTFVDQCYGVYSEYTLFSPCPETPQKIVKQIYFPTYGGLLTTDFFEALLHGQYARQCEICGKYFLATVRNPQHYCNGLSKESVNGNRLSCRQVAARQGKKERSKNDPRKDIYRRRNACIRSETSRGTISKPFAEKAKMLTKEHLERSIVDMDYALNQYRKDMERNNLYAEVKSRWNIEC